MASSGKKKTTMAKLNRERKLVEKRAAKEQRKIVRKREAAGESAPRSDAERGDAAPRHTGPRDPATVFLTPR